MEEQHKKKKYIEVEQVFELGGFVGALVSYTYFNKRQIWLVLID